MTMMIDHVHNRTIDDVVIVRSGSTKASVSNTANANDNNTNIMEKKITTKEQPQQSRL